MHEVIDRVAFDEACSPVLAPETAAPPRTRLALVGGFLPRRCGIATFTTDIHASLRLAVPDHAIDIYAMTPAVDAIAFDPSICSTITEGDAKRDRKSVVSGKSVSVRVDRGGRRIIQKTKR